MIALAIFGAFVIGVVAGACTLVVIACCAASSEASRAEEEGTCAPPSRSLAQPLDDLRPEERPRYGGNG